MKSVFLLIFCLVLGHFGHCREHCQEPNGLDKVLNEMLANNEFQPSKGNSLKTKVKEGAIIFDFNGKSGQSEVGILKEEVRVILRDFREEAKRDYDVATDSITVQYDPKEKKIEFKIKYFAVGWNQKIIGVSFLKPNKKFKAILTESETTKGLQ